jgi:hypothetical protein
MDGIECPHVGVAINFNPDTLAVNVVMTMHDEDGLTLGWVRLPSGNAAEIGAALMNRALEVRAMEVELEDTPLDDRPVVFNTLLDRMQSPTN